MCRCCHKRSSRGTQILTRRSESALGLENCLIGRLKMVIFIYSNILLSVSMMNMTNMRVRCGHERPLRLFEVLARNRQSAVGLSGRTIRAREQPPRMFTIPPRQQLSFTTRLAIRTWRAAHIVIIIIYIILNTRTFYMLNTHVHFLKIFFSEM